jgi:hypothetical protein
LSGPFAGALCRLVHSRANGRVRVLFEIMRGQAPLQLERSCTVPAA